MKEHDVELILQRAHELYPDAADNLRQWSAVHRQRLQGIRAPVGYDAYPHIAVIERWHKSMKAECIRPQTPLSEQDAQRLMSRFVDHYNQVRLHYVTPADMLHGWQKEILEARDSKLEAAREQRKQRREKSKSQNKTRVLCFVPPTGRYDHCLAKRKQALQGCNQAEG